MARSTMLGGMVAALAIAFASPTAQTAGEGPERCPRLIAWEGARVLPAAFSRLAQAADDVRITFVGHASFLIESPAGVSIVTDYNDFVRPPGSPTIATTNIAHSTHHSGKADHIAYLLPGWARTARRHATTSKSTTFG